MFHDALWQQPCPLATVQEWENSITMFFSYLQGKKEKDFPSPGGMRILHIPTTSLFRQLFMIDELSFRNVDLVNQYFDK